MNMETENLKILKNKIRNLSGQSGCYLWKNESDDVIYVGKALDLSDRVSSYLSPSITDLKTLSLQKEIFDLDWIITGSEEEALILEATLIKKYSPKYNIRLKDDKKYPYLCISTNEKFPMIYLTRNIKSDGKKYFGPFTEVKSARDLLSLVHRIFPIRKTVQTLPLKKPGRPCLNFHIKRCLGPCTGNVSEQEYNEIIMQIMRFLEGKKSELIIDLQKRMQELSEEMKFERAAIYRDMIEALQAVQRRQTVVRISGGDEDILSLAKKDDHGQMVVFEVRSGRLEGKKSFAMSGMLSEKDEDIFLTFIKLYYLNSDYIPEKIMLPLKPDKNLTEFTEILGRKKDIQIKLRDSRNGSTRGISRLALKNAEMNLTERLLSVKMREEKEALTDLMKMLHLKTEPSVIECYDISHFQGTEPVGSGVMFVDGNPYKPGYRHYRIKSYTGINDPGMIHEVIARRLQRLLNENESLPDLIVIDGGYTQLTRATEAAVALDLPLLPMIGLAKKREEIYVPGEKIPYRFDINSPGLRLLQRLRNEAHRFGVTYHRQRRNEKTLKSALQDIPDIGPARKKEILKYFSGKKKVENADLGELKRVPGIGEKLAEKIFESLHRNQGFFSEQKTESDR